MSFEFLPVVIITVFGEFISHHKIKINVQNVSVSEWSSTLEMHGNDNALEMHGNDNALKMHGSCCIKPRCVFSTGGLNSPVNLVIYV